MDAGEYLGVVLSRSATLLELASQAMNRPVPGCPGWDVGLLVRHVGTVWGWAAAVVTTGESANEPLAPEHATNDRVISWARDQASALQAALETADPISNCWTFGEPRSSLFWFRRQALETAVHAWDVEQTLKEPDPLASALAGDGIEEFLTVILPRRVKQHGEPWHGQSLGFRCSDDKREWLVQLGPEARVSVQRDVHAGEVIVRSSASSLYLWCLNRVPLANLEILGNHEVLGRWTAEIAF